MKVSYLDTSFFLAMALDERGSRKLIKAFRSFDRVLTSGLLEAEALAAFKREKVPMESAGALFDSLDWVFPDLALGVYLQKVLRVSYLRGADAYHLAAALWALGDEVPSCHFLTLDRDQARVAADVGFQVLSRP